MTSKFKIEYYHKMPTSTSPYLQLLQAKKKVFGYKYELIRSEKSQHNKSTGHQPSHKHSKTQSHEKQRSRQQKMNSRKKRSHTEQAEERLHESLFLNRDSEQYKEGKHQATKSLFTVEGGIDQSINPQDFMKNYRNLVDYDDNKNMRSSTQQVESKTIPRERQQGIGHSLEKLQINQIDDLLALIDNCVQEANDYIGYLTEKIETLKSENSSIKEQQSKLLKLKDGIINEKDRELDRLKKELHHQRPEVDKTFEIKKLLEIIDKMTEENNSMKLKLREFEAIEPKSVPVRETSQKEKKDIYNQIHNKIDILNISIDKKHKEQQAELEGSKESKKHRQNKGRFYR